MKAVRTIARFPQGLWLIGFSADGKEFAIVGEKLGRLETETGKQLWSIPIVSDGIPLLVLSPEASRLFLARGAGNSMAALHLEIWDAVPGKKMGDLKSTPQQ
jgi:hypothetical protein